MASRVFADAGSRRILAIDPSAVGASYDEAEAESEVGNIACICIDGPLAQHDDGHFESYERVTERVKMCLESPDVSAIVLKFDSPGGDVAGLFEAVNTMQMAKRKAGKPIVGYVDEACYSAAYALAMVADKIYMPASAGCGSVGVITCMVDTTEANEAAGIRVEVITSGDQKADGHPDTPMTDAAISRTQSRVDDLADMFFAVVAKARKLSPKVVAAYQAGIFIGQDAIDAGLADGIVSWSILIEMVGAMAVAAPKEQSMKATSKLAAVRAANAADATKAKAPVEAEVKFKHTKTNKMTEVIESEDDPTAVKEEGSEESDDEDEESSEDAVKTSKKASASTDARAMMALVEQVTGTRDPNKMRGALFALRDSQARERTLAARLEALETDREQEKLFALIESGMKAGKLMPAQRKWAATLDVDSLRAYLAATPAMVNSREHAHQADETPKKRVATQAMIDIWTKSGLKPSQFDAALANLSDAVYARLENM